MSPLRELSTSPPHAPSIGRLGAYDVLGAIGEGGMGSVYAARHRLTGELRALKVLKSELASSREFVERFLREVRVAASLRHENLVQVMDPGIDGDVVFLPMELLHGETLASLLARVRRLDAHDAATILLCLARGLSAIHAAGVLHRDVKPANAFLSIGPGSAITPKLLDFGMAREVGDTEHTRTGIVAGSPYYMAPEQAAGSKDLDPRVDQYALAVVAYQMVTGRRPYESDDGRSALAKLLRREPYPRVRELERCVPEGCALAIERALSPDAPQRFPSVAAFALAFAQPVAARLGSVSAVAALAGGSDAVLDTTPDESGRSDAIDPERAEAAARVLASLEPSGLLSIPLAAPLSAPNVPAPTMVLDSSVVPVSGVQATAHPAAREAAGPIATHATALLPERARSRARVRRALPMIVAGAVVLALLVALVVGALLISSRRGAGASEASGSGAVDRGTPPEIEPPDPSAAGAAPAAHEPSSPPEALAAEPPTEEATAREATPAIDDAPPESAPASREASAPAARESDDGPRVRGRDASRSPSGMDARPERDRSPCVPVNGIPCIE